MTDTSAKRTDTRRHRHAVDIVGVDRVTQRFEIAYQFRRADTDAETRARKTARL